jgi:APA family basic amino acid/polyamine antiporter
LNEKVATTVDADALPRVLSGVDAAALAVGIIVGTGIFAVPGFVARELAAPGPILVAWILGGGIALAGALTYAELASMFPRQGGSFLYVLHAFGPFAAFFKGWGSFLVGNPASSAAIASILGIYVADGMGWGERAVRPIAIAAATAVWALNLRGTRFSGSLATALTMTKVGAIGILAVLALAVGPGSWARLGTGWGAGAWPGPAAFAAALVGVVWTYDGWPNLTVLGGEVTDARRRMGQALIATIAVVTALYVLVNVGYLVLLPLEQLMATESVAASSARAVLGDNGARLLSFLVALSAFGSLFGISIAAPRFFYAMGKSGLFFEAAGQVDPRTAAPRWGTTALWALTVVYVATGRFEQIMGYYVAISLLYNMLAVAAVYRLRRTRPDEERAFRVPGYPVVPAVFLAAAAWITGTEIARNPLRNGVGVLILAASWPAYRWWRRRR